MSFGVCCVCDSNIEYYEDDAVINRISDGYLCLSCACSNLELVCECPVCVKKVSDILRSGENA